MKFTDLPEFPALEFSVALPIRLSAILMFFSPPVTLSARGDVTGAKRTFLAELYPAQRCGKISAADNNIKNGFVSKPSCRKQLAVYLKNILL
ncbi:MAG: hypothetical protein E7H57_18995 [Pantoea sp.]|nr:hypothetical protein [Pantoea sp.]